MQRERKKREDAEDEYEKELPYSQTDLPGRLNFK